MNVCRQMMSQTFAYNDVVPRRDLIYGSVSRGPSGLLQSCNVECSPTPASSPSKDPKKISASKGGRCGPSCPTVSSVMDGIFLIDRRLIRYGLPSTSISSHLPCSVGVTVI